MSKVIHFEQSVTELEAIVKQLEQGELPLEDALQQFEKGINLARSCQSILQKAEQRIQTLTANPDILSSSSDESKPD